MDTQENQIQTKWYYLSDEKPMENIIILKNWTIYNNSEDIESNFPTIS